MIATARRGAKGTHRKKEAMNIYIRDDNGNAWYFADGRIRCVLSELDGVPYEENGYPCKNFEEGIKYLNESGYITGEDYPF